MSSQEDILEALKQAVIKFREKDCRKAAMKALDLGIDPMIAVEHGLVSGMEKVGILFDTNEYFVPEVMLSTDAFYAALDILGPHIQKKPSKPNISIVMGSIQGDIHDIGKNLVKIMFEIQGWEIYDLGRDVPIEKFVKKHLEIKSNIIAISAMMTTTMIGIKKMIAQVKKKNPDCLVMVGGASVTREIAYFFGADGYAASFGTVVAETLKMIEQYNSPK